MPSCMYPYNVPKHTGSESHPSSVQVIGGDPRPNPRLKPSSHVTMTVSPSWYGPGKLNVPLDTFGVGHATVNK